MDDNAQNDQRSAARTDTPGFPIPKSNENLPSAAESPIEAQSDMPPVSSTSFQGPQVNSNEPQPAATPIQTGQAETDVPPESNLKAEGQFNPVTAYSKKRGLSRFKVFILVSILAIAAIYSIVAYLYLQNKKMKQNVSQTEVTEEVAVEDSSLTITEPEVVPSAETVKISNGNVILQSSLDTSNSRVLVDKQSYTSTGITGFARVEVSPDSKMICFESWPPAPEPAFFLANSDGSQIKEVSPNRKNCLWSKDSQNIYYSDYGSPTKSSDIYSYNITTTEEKNLTLASQTSTKNRQFSIVGLSADASKLICTYKDAGKQEANCEIDLFTMEVTLSEE